MIKQRIKKICPICNNNFEVIPSLNNIIFCSRKCNNIHQSNIKKGKSNLGSFKKGKIPWNKGLTKEDDERLLSISEKSRQQMNREYENGTRNRFEITKNANNKCNELIKEGNWILQSENHPMRGKHHTEDTKRKQSQSKLGIKNPMYGKSPSEETRRKNSELNKGRKKSEESIKKAAEKNRGQKRSKEQKAKMSEIQKKMDCHKGKNCNFYGKPPSKLAGRGKGCHYNSSIQGKIWLRSSYELAYAQYLDENNIPWLYEIQTFDLDNTTYTPDFYFPTCDLFIEIKGYMTDKAQEKINKFLDNYIDETLLILRKEDLIKLGIKI